MSGSAPNHNARRVVVTGLGWVTSLGTDVDQVWEDLLRGRSGVHPVRRFSTDDYSVKFGGEVSDWQGGPHLDQRVCKRMDRFSQFGLSSSIDAANDAGLELDKENPFRVGVQIGSGIGGIEEFENGHAKMLAKGPHRVSPMMIPKLMINAASGNVAIHYGLRGPNSAAVTACASAGHAIADAYNAVRSDEADVMLAGGSEAALTPLGLACFMTMKALSERNDDPAAASRPFDVSRDGFVMSEGAGVLVLEEYEHAKKRGAPIYAEMCGYGTSADGSHITAPEESGEGAREAMSRAVQSVGIDLTDIDFISAHATSTDLGDRAESNAISGLFGDYTQKVPVFAAKSMTGHTLGAAGGLEGVMLAKSVQTGDIPPTINLEQADERCPLNHVANEAQHRDIRYALSNNFGFGGHNVSILLRRM